MAGRRSGAGRAGGVLCEHAGAADGRIGRSDVYGTDRESKTLCAGSVRHQEVPFERLVEALQPERSQSRHPLFQVVLVLQNAPEARLELPRLNIQQVAVPNYQSQFDLALTLNEHFDSAGNAAGIAGTWEYSLDLFEPESVINLASAFVHILLQAVKEPKQRLRQLEVSFDVARSTIPRAAQIV